MPDILRIYLLLIQQVLDFFFTEGEKEGFPIQFFGSIQLLFKRTAKCLCGRMGNQFDDILPQRIIHGCIGQQRRSLVEKRAIIISERLGDFPVVFLFLSKTVKNFETQKICEK